MSQQPDGRLENWIRVGSVILGDIYDDAKGRFEDGTRISTSAVEEIQTEHSIPVTVITRNSVYTLGKHAEA